MYFTYAHEYLSAVVKHLAIAIGAGDLGFDSRAAQVELSVANGSPPLPRLFYCHHSAPSRITYKKQST